MDFPWGGISCCFGAAALYLLGRGSERDAEVLKSVTRVHQLKDLAQLLDTAIKVLPFVVTASGRVGSDTPIICEHNGLRDVIVKETTKQHFLKHNDKGSWIRDYAMMPSTCKEVPWYLDDGTGRVYVIGARNATGLVLTVGSEVFEETGQSIERGPLDHLQGLKMLGVERTQRVLPTGTPLAVVGEAVKDNIGTIRIERPHKGLFFVTQKPIDQLISDLVNSARWYKFASIGLTVFGACLLAKHTFHYITERWRQWKLRKRVIAAADADNNQGQDSEGSAENGLQFCVICSEQEYNSVFVPCGHMCCCTTCSVQLTNCPLCRRWIQQVVRTFRQ